MEQFFMSASYSVDVAVSAWSDELVAAFQGIDERLRRRCLLFMELRVPQTRPLVSDYLPTLTEAGWDYCTLGTNMSGRRAFAIVDGKTVAIQQELGGWLMSRQQFDVRHLNIEFDWYWQVAQAGDEDFEIELAYEAASDIWTPDGRQRILVDSQGHWGGIIASLGANPELLYQISPRDFEELVANLLEREGMEVHLTPFRKDEGRDILAFQETAFGRHLFLVECKRYSANRPVGVGLVRALFGVIAGEKATAGLLVTTSRFTRGALAFGQSVQHQMGLKDYSELVRWLQRQSKKRIEGD